MPYEAQNVYPARAKLEQPGKHFVVVSKSTSYNYPMSARLTTSSDHVSRQNCYRPPSYTLAYEDSHVYPARARLEQPGKHCSLLANPYPIVIPWARGLLPPLIMCHIILSTPSYALPHEDEHVDMSGKQICISLWIRNVDPKTFRWRYTSRLSQATKAQANL